MREGEREGERERGCKGQLERGSSWDRKWAGAPTGSSGNYGDQRLSKFNFLTSTSGYYGYSTRTFVPTMVTVLVPLVTMVIIVPLATVVTALVSLE